LIGGGHQSSTRAAKQRNADLATTIDEIIEG
jgi:hypothetical protein